MSAHCFMVIGQLCKKASQYTAYSDSFAQSSGVFIYPDTFQIELQLTLKFSHVGTEWRHKGCNQYKPSAWRKEMVMLCFTVL